MKGIIPALAGWFFLRNGILHQGDFLGLAEERPAGRLALAFGAEMTAEHRELTADFALYREDRARQRRLLRRGVQLAEGAERALFRALVRWHRL